MCPRFAGGLVSVRPRARICTSTHGAPLDDHLSNMPSPFQKGSFGLRAAALLKTFSLASFVLLSMGRTPASPPPPQKIGPSEHKRIAQKLACRPVSGHEPPCRRPPITKSVPWARPAPRLPSRRGARWAAVTQSAHRFSPSGRMKVNGHFAAASIYKIPDGFSDQRGRLTGMDRTAGPQEAFATRIIHQCLRSSGNGPCNPARESEASSL